MRAIARELFVPEAARAVAYMDETIPLGAGRSLLTPRVLAKMIQCLELSESDVVLDVAAASGYSTAILAQIAQTVVALEVSPELAQVATAALEHAEVDNAVVLTGPLPDGMAEEGPYDAILINGAIEIEPTALLDQLKDGGRLVAVQIEDGYGRAKQWRRLEGGSAARVIFDTAAPLLPGFEQEHSFTF